MPAAEKGSEDATVVQPGLTRAPGSWLQRRVWLLDLLVALAVFLYNLPTLPVYSLDWPRLAALAAVSLGICGPYLLRRRYPLIVLGVMLVAACSQFLVGREATLIAADVMLVFAVYNVATRFRWQVSVPAAAAIVAWLLIAARELMQTGWLNIGEAGLLVVLVAWVWTWGTLVRIRRDYIAGLEKHAQHLEREREAKARIAVVEERARIAREVHDIVSHSLSVVVLMSEGAASKVDEEPERAQSAMLTVRDTGRTALAEMRRMLGVLREGEPGSHAPQPGTAQLDRLIDESNEAGLPVTLTVKGQPVEISTSLDLAVYRVVQEALTNVRKHAGPAVNQVEVWLHYGTGELEVRITDDGQGPGDDAGREHGGHGLLGMHERIAAYGGTIRAGARSSGGFEVTAVLPTRAST